MRKKSRVSRADGAASAAVAAHAELKRLEEGFSAVDTRRSGGDGARNLAAEVESFKLELAGTIRATVQREVRKRKSRREGVDSSALDRHGGSLIQKPPI